jgi:DNA mismatch endonuclease, patch repair protein
MADVVDAATRSRMMAGIQSKNTKPETLIRKALHARGFRYSLHPKRLPGKPDIVMPKWRVVIFVHGCFWHWHGCRMSKLPTSNASFWQQKLMGNQLRDAEVKQALVNLGWRSATVWECATRGKTAQENLPNLLNALDSWIRYQAKSMTFELCSMPADPPAALAAPDTKK